MFIMFFLFWVIFNGKITVEITVIGLIIAAVMYGFICKFMEYSIQKDLTILKNVFYIIQYILILIKEIVLANFATIKIIFSRDYKKEPVIVKFTTELQTKTAKVILANSITLTPGTITVSLEEDEFAVHCLDKKFSTGMDSSVFVKLLKRMEQNYYKGNDKQLAQEGKE